MRKTVLAASVIALVAVSCGGPRAEVHDLTERPDGSNLAQIQEGEQVDQAEHGAVVEVVMTDFAFASETSTFEVGETVTFVFRNMGAIAHDAVIGTEEERQAHAAEMTGSSEAHMEEEEEEEEDSAAIDLRPGGTGTVIYTFTEPGDLLIACTLPNHFEAGMRTDIGVTA